MFIGSLGTVIFQVGHDRIRTFRELSRRRQVKSARHDVLNGLPRLQHTGRDLDELSLTVVLERMSNHDYLPDQSITALLELAEAGEEVPLMLGLRYYGLWFVQSVSPAHKIIHNGTTWRAEVALSLVEYDLTPSLEAYARAAAYAAEGLAGQTALGAVSSVVEGAAGMSGIVAQGISGLNGVIAAGASSLVSFIAGGALSLDSLVADGLLDLNELVRSGLLDFAGLVPAGVTDFNALAAEGGLSLDALALSDSLDISGLVTGGAVNLSGLAGQGALKVEVLVEQGASDLYEQVTQSMFEVMKTMEKTFGPAA